MYTYSVSSQSNNKKTTLEEKLPSDKLMALDLAIIWSIEQCGEFI